MVALPPRFRDVLDLEPLPLSAAGADMLEGFSAPQLRVIVSRAHNLLGNGMGPVLVELGLRKDEIPPLLTADALRAHAAFAAVMAGQRPLRAGEPDRDLVCIAQHALQAVSARVAGAPAEMRMAGWGADGSFGNETRAALAAFRAWLGPSWASKEAGELGAKEARKLAELLDEQSVPALWAEMARGARIEQAARRIVDIAVGICEATPERPYTRKVDGRVYRYTAAMFGVLAPENTLLAAPGGVGYGLRKGNVGFWKCNVFCGVVLSLAELPVSTFPVGPHRHYPRAERFGPRLADKPGWRLVRHLDHREPEDLTRPVVGDAQDEEIRQLLGDARPGDILFVDHPGEPGDDGGHARVCTAPARPGDPDVAPLWAQASSDAALERRDGMAELAGGQETQFWLLRYQG